MVLVDLVAAMKPKFSDDPLRFESSVCL